MSFRNDLISIVNKVIYNNSFDMKILERKLAIDKEDEILLIANDLLLRVSKRDNSLILEDILFGNYLKGKGLCYSFIGELIEYCKENNFSYFMVESIISNKLDIICESYKMDKDFDCIYGDIDYNLYDFDGFLGRRFICTKKEC